LTKTFKLQSLFPFNVAAGTAVRGERCIAVVVANDDKCRGASDLLQRRPKIPARWFDDATDTRGRRYGCKTGPTAAAAAAS